jgi:ADP-ribose pyrophosphatase YjhB (NUDIX family)
MSMYSHEWNWCPWCGHKLVERHIFHADRMACPSCDFIYFPRPNVVVMVIVEHEGKILLGRRNMEPGRGKWTFVGGFVNREETVAQAAVREVKEETGLDVELDGLVGVYDELVAGLVLPVYGAHVKHANADLTAQAHEIGDLAFFSLDALPELAFVGDTQIIEDWRRGAGTR